MKGWPSCLPVIRLAFRFSGRLTAANLVVLSARYRACPSLSSRRNPLPRTWVWTVCVPWLYCREVCRGLLGYAGSLPPPPPDTATSNISRTVPMAHAYNALSVRKRLFKLHRNRANSPILIMLSGKQEHATHLREHMNAMRPHLLLFAGERGLLFKPSSGDQPVFWRPAATPETVQRIR